VVLNEMEMVFVCDIRDDRYVTMVSVPISSTSLERLSIRRVSQDTQFRKKVLLVMALVSLELIVKEV